VRVIDPAPSVARQALRLLEAAHARAQAGASGHVQYFTSGDTIGLERMLRQLLGLDARARRLEWLSETHLVQQGISVALKDNDA